MSTTSKERISRAGIIIVGSHASLHCLAPGCEPRRCAAHREGACVEGGAKGSGFFAAYDVAPAPLSRLKAESRLG